LKTPPQSKNSNLITTAIVKKYKVTPYWIIDVDVKGIFDVKMSLASRRTSVKSVVSSCRASTWSRQDDLLRRLWSTPTHTRLFAIQVT